jgi:hypothetical protein
MRKFVCSQREAPSRASAMAAAETIIAAAQESMTKRRDMGVLP